MRQFDYEYLVDGKPLLLPDAGVELKLADVECPGSGRDEAGFWHRTVLRPRLRSWRFSYAVVRQEELRYLTELLSGRSWFDFTFRAGDGREETARCFCQGFTAQLEDRKLGLYKGLKFTVEEC